MAKYRMEVLAYQEVEVEADSLEEAMSKGILEGVDTSCAEWETRNIYKYCEEDGFWEKAYD